MLSMENHSATISLMNMRKYLTQYHSPNIDSMLKIISHIRRALCGLHPIASFMFPVMLSHEFIVLHCLGLFLGPSKNLLRDLGQIHFHGNLKGSVDCMSCQKSCHRNSNLSVDISHGLLTTIYVSRMPQEQALFVEDSLYNCYSVV